MTPRLTVLYGRDADAYSVARDVDRALEGDGCHVTVDGGDVCIWRRGQPVSEAARFVPGQRLVVTYDEGWRIESADAAVTT